MTALRFTLADLEHAADTWRCSCGPASLAAICGLTLEEVRRLLSTFTGWMNPSMMLGALSNLRKCGGPRYRETRRVSATQALDWPRYGLARIQFEGPWTAPGANPRWAYRHTHWVGVQTIGDVVSIWDVNAFDADLGPASKFGWCLLDRWRFELVPELTADIPRASGGWHVTHAIEVSR